ncbi:hypothetical protein M9H77_07229 [Catharanthus roseus]|uniref:Uncharacterized protein n=1 Tax=Catharanthus roseus TaxID=4058 RepID=A0ACC0BUB3_CATRO|nr:hypothetical protein M9H77_07229 [Catharanthus roseus]
MEYTWSNSPWQRLEALRNKRIINPSLQEIRIISIMVVAMESMLMLEATMDMGNSFLEDMMVMQISLLKNIMELVTSLLRLNLMSILLTKISNEDSYDTMNGKRIEKEECNEFKEKEKVDEKESLSENSCYSYYISTLCEKLEKDECTKEKAHELEKRESTKENECFIEKQEIIEKEQKEREVVALDKSKVKFLTQNMENERSLNYKIYKTISLFTPTSYISLEHPYTWTSKIGRNHTMKSEVQGDIVGKELFQFHENSSMSPFLNPSLLIHEVSYEELKLLLASYVSHMSIIEDVCSISIGGHLFLVVPYVSICSHTSFAKSLMHSGVKFDPSCMLNDASLVDPNIVSFKLECV